MPSSSRKRRQQQQQQQAEDALSAAAGGSLGFVIDTQPSRRLARVVGEDVEVGEEEEEEEDNDDDVEDAEDEKLEEAMKEKKKKKEEQKQELWRDSDDKQFVGRRRDSRRRREFLSAFGPTPEYFLPGDKDKDKDKDKDQDDEDEDEDEDDAVALNVLSATLPDGRLPPRRLQYQRLRDANKESPSHRRLTSVEFNRRARVLLTTSADCRFALFEVDPEQRVFDRLHSHHLPGFPISCGRFAPDGNRIVLTSCHRSFRVFDILSERLMHISRIMGVENNCKLTSFEISPDQKYIAFVGKFGEVFLVDYKSHNRISTLRAPNSTVRCFAFTSDGSQLLTAGTEGIVGRFHLQHHDTKLISQFHDEGSCDTLRLSVANSNQLVACGSSSGIVNVYDWQQAAEQKFPKPLHTVQNLTTECGTLRFNSTNELLLLASPREPQAVRLLHTASGAVMGNFPESRRTLASVHCGDFSPNSGFLVLGQHTGRAALLRLQHYPAY